MITQLELKNQLKNIHGDVYTTNEMQELFKVHSFLAPLVFVTQKTTGKKGTMEFTHLLRFYFNFTEYT